MISGMAATAVAGINAAYANFDSAASAAVAESSPESTDTGDFAAAVIAMDQSKVQIAAAISVAKKINEMLAESISNADYGVKGP